MLLYDNSDGFKISLFTEKMSILITDLIIKLWILNFQYKDLKLIFFFNWPICLSRIRNLFNKFWKIVCVLLENVKHLLPHILKIKKKNLF